MARHMSQVVQHEQLQLSVTTSLAVLLKKLPLQNLILGPFLGLTTACHFSPTRLSSLYYSSSLNLCLPLLQHPHMSFIWACRHLGFTTLNFPFNIPSAFVTLVLGNHKLCRCSEICAHNSHRAVCALAALGEGNRSSQSLERGGSISFGPIR